MEAKDLTRLEDIRRKADGDMSKAESLANHMAALIKDREKAYRRFEAAQHVFGNSHPVTQVFLRRWHVLNGKVLMEPVPVAPTRKQRERVMEAAPKEDRVVAWGVDNPDEGDENLNNSLTVKGYGKGIMEIWETWSKEVVWVIHEGKKPKARVKTVANFNDENGKFIFGGTMLDWCSTEDRAEAEKKYGKAVESRMYI